MPSTNQINYLLLCKDRIAEPILIVGSKEYDFDEENFLEQLHSCGYSNVTGIDLSVGAGVDHVVNICDESSSFISNNLEGFQTIICMQVQQHDDESQLAFLIRRVHRKYLSKGVFQASRLLPEISIFSLATKTKDGE